MGDCLIDAIIALTFRIDDFGTDEWVSIKFPLSPLELTDWETGDYNDEDSE